MTEDQIKTESDFWEYCTIYSKEIFVREKNCDGKWFNSSLEDLTPLRRVYHIKRMLARGFIPTRSSTKEE